MKRKKWRTWRNHQGYGVPEDRASRHHDPTDIYEGRKDDKVEEPLITLSSFGWAVDTEKTELKSSTGDLFWPSMLASAMFPLQAAANAGSEGLLVDYALLHAADLFSSFL